MVAVAICNGRGFYANNPIAKRCPKHPGDGSSNPDADCDMAGLSFFIPCYCGGNPDCFVCMGWNRERITDCPFSFDLREAAEWVQLHRHYPNALPLAGGLLEQPWPYVLAMRILDRAHSIMQESVNGR